MEKTGTGVRMKSERGRGNTHQTLPPPPCQLLQCCGRGELLWARWAAISLGGTMTAAAVCCRWDGEGRYLPPDPHEGDCRPVHPSQTHKPPAVTDRHIVTSPITPCATACKIDRGWWGGLIGDHELWGRPEADQQNRSCCCQPWMALPFQQPLSAYIYIYTPTACGARCPACASPALPSPQSAAHLRRSPRATALCATA